jgi:hypothetical protein
MKPSHIVLAVFPAVFLILPTDRAIAGTEGLVRVTVTYPDGRPAADARVTFTIRNPSGRVSNLWAKCQTDGTCARSAEAGSHCLIAADKTGWASAIAARVVSAGGIEERIHLTLHPTARVHGTITVGKDRQPIADAYVVLFQRDEDHDSKSPQDQQLLNWGSAKGVTLTRYGRADRKGHFEFFVGPGHYSLIGGSAPSFSGLERLSEFDVNDAKDLEIDLHQDRLSRVGLKGRIVLSSDRGQGISGASVGGASLDAHVGGPFNAISNGSGYFETTRVPTDMLVEAQSNDGLLAGMFPISADDTDIVIALAPAASVRARLVDERTGQPLSGITVAYWLQTNGKTVTLGLRTGRPGRSDSRGEVTLSGLVPGWKYVLQALTETRGHRKWVPIGTIAPVKADVTDLGTIKLTTPARASAIHNRSAS